MTPGILDWFIQNNKGLNYYIPDKFKNESDAFKAEYLKETQQRMRDNLSAGLAAGALQDIPSIFQYENFDAHNDNDPFTTENTKAYFDAYRNKMGLNTLNNYESTIQALTHENTHGVRGIFDYTPELASGYWDKIPLDKRKSMVDRYNTWTQQEMGYKGSPYFILKDPYYKDDSTKYNIALEEILADRIGMEGGPSQMKKPGLWNDKEFELLRQYWNYKRNRAWGN